MIELFVLMNISSSSLWNTDHHHHDQLLVKVSELRDRASLEWSCLGDKHVEWCCQWIFLCAWFDSIGDEVVRVNWDKLSLSSSSSSIHNSLTQISNAAYYGIFLFFSFEKRDTWKFDFFLLSLSDKI